MDSSNLFATILVLVVFALSIIAEPGVENYQSHHSQKVQRGPNEVINTFQNLPKGKCWKEVPVSELSRGSHRHVGNSSNPGFFSIQACCAGYREVVRGICEPICTKSCRNGKCVDPDVCQCLPGYTMSLAGECINTCPFGCLNGHCTNVLNCTCNPGYKLDANRKFCIPQCSQDCGSYGNCTAPNVCGCKKGYGLNIRTNKCEPQCDPQCGNGECVAPGECRCFQGYFLKDKTCQTNCSGGCLNGRCVAPQSCVCDPGWNLSPSRNRCEPTCEGGCPNGLCVKPNTCECLKGYEKKLFTSNACKPVCERGCHKGNCIAPDTCQCEPGFTLNSARNRCNKVHQNTPAPQPVVQPPIFRPTVSVVQQPKCTPNCINSQCTGTNRCSCWEHYMPDPHVRHRCNPVCANGCGNGTCIAPNNCVCNPGFEKMGNSCIHKKTVTTTPRPRCRQECINGYCWGDKCMCLSGYIEDPGNKFKCMPLCTQGCANGTCVAPHTCQCLPGFERKTPYACEKPMPRCDKPCLNGYCAGRNICQCNPGYAVQGNEFNQCTPVCVAGCPNGYCMQPNKCACNQGFTMRNNVCVWTGFQG